MRRVLSLIAAIVFVACYTDNQYITTPLTDNSQLLISASTPDSASRVDFSGNDSGGYSIAWSQDDKLGGWCSSQSQFSQFSILEWGASCSTFSGSFSSVLSGEDKVRFVYPYLGSTTFAAANPSQFSVDLSSQSSLGGGDLTNLKSSTYMVSGTSLYGDDISLSMSHIGAVIDLNIKLSTPSDATLSSVAISGSDGLEIPTVATLDLATESVDEMVTPSAYGQITIEATAPIEANESDIYTLSFTTFPFDLSSGESISIVATFVDSQGESFEASRVITIDGDSQFERATRNSLNAIVTAELTETLVATLDGSMFPSSYDSGSFTTNDITIDYVYCKTSTAGNIQMSSSNPSTICNTTAIDSLTKVVVTFEESGEEFKFASGSSLSALTSAIYSCGDSNEYSCTLPSGSEYFSIEAYSGGVMRIVSIEIYAMR